jgi:Protein of unknown function (DUF3592)
MLLGASFNITSFWQNASPVVRLCLVLAEIAFIFFLAKVANFILLRRKQHREEIEQSWPSVEGTVQYTSTAPVFDNKHGQYYATLEYSYFVGEYRSGKCIQSFGDDSEAEADAFAEVMKDKKVQVLYNPSNPDKSDLDPSSIEQHTMFATKLS